MESETDMVAAAGEHPETRRLYQDGPSPNLPDHGVGEGAVLMRPPFLPRSSPLPGRLHPLRLDGCDA